MVKYTKLSGGTALDVETGDVYMLYGERNWFKRKIGNISGTQAYTTYRAKHGTPEGKKYRSALGQAILRSAKWRIG